MKRILLIGAPSLLPPDVWSELQSLAKKEGVCLERQDELAVVSPAEPPTIKAEVYPRPSRKKWSGKERKQQFRNG